MIRETFLTTFESQGQGYQLSGFSFMQRSQYADLAVTIQVEVPRGEPDLYLMSEANEFDCIRV